MTPLEDKSNRMKGLDLILSGSRSKYYKSSYFALLGLFYEIRS